MRSIYYCFLIIVVPSFSFGQKVGNEFLDSLQREYKTVDSDMDRVRIKLEMSAASFENPEVAIEYANAALELAKRIDYSKGIAQAQMTIGEGKLILRDFEDALENFIKARDIFKQIGDRVNYAEALLSIGSVQWIQSRYPQALKLNLEALAIQEEIGDKSTLAATYCSVGVIYENMGNLPEALKYYNVSLTLAEETGEKFAMAILYTNIGNVLEVQKNYKEALRNHLQSLEIFEELGDDSGLAAVYGHIGTLYKSMGEFKDALRSQFQSLKIREAQGDPFGICSNLNEIGILKILMGQSEEGKKYLLRALKVSKDINSLKWINESYRRLSIADSALGKYESAFENYKKHIIYRDSIFNKENIKKLTETEMNYIFEKRQDSLKLISEKEIAIRDATLQINKREKIFYFSGLIALSVIGGLLFNQSRLRKRKNRELDAANRVKTRFFSILNHDLRSPVSQLIGFLYLMKENPGTFDSATRDRLEQKTITGAENLLGAMENLLLWCKTQMENFKTNPRNVSVKQLFEDVQKYFSATEEIRITFSTDEFLELFVDKDYLETIVRNLTANAIKALENIPDGLIHWEAENIGRGIRLCITDNGPGADNEKFRALYDETEVIGIKSGLGMHLIRDLAKAIGCEVTVVSTLDTGTTIHLFFKKNEENR